MKAAVYCADIGSLAGRRFGWSGHRADRVIYGDDASGLANHVAADLLASRPVALGFECPLFVPIPADQRHLGFARQGEGSRPWSAAAGAAVLATGLVQVVWVLREVRRAVGDGHRAYLGRDEFLAAGRGLLLWEAFVTGSAKSGDHCGDAEVAVMAFEIAMASPQCESAVTCPQDTHSLIGAALLRTGWTDDASILGSPCLVIKASAVNV